MFVNLSVYLGIAMSYSFYSRCMIRYKLSLQAMPAERQSCSAVGYLLLLHRICCTASMVPIDPIDNSLKGFSCKKLQILHMLQGDPSPGELHLLLT